MFARTLGIAFVGLIEAQKAAIEAYARQTGAVVLAFYTEVESSKLATRPELAKALAHARRGKATLTIRTQTASRCISWPRLPKPKPRPRPSATARKAALAAYKARGGKLGGTRPECRNLTPEAMAKGRAESAKARGKAVVEAYADLQPSWPKCGPRE